MTRYVLLAFLCLGASVSRAEGMLPGGATVAFEKLFIHEDGKEFQEPSTEDEQLQYFNYAHCTCAQSNRATPNLSFNQDVFQWLITVDNPMNAVIDEPLQLWTGTECNLVERRDPNTGTCIQVGTTSDISVIAGQNGTYETINILDLVSPRAMGQTCPDIEQEMYTWALAEGSDTTVPLDYSVSKSIKVDTEAPDMPSNWNVKGAENAIEISWTPPDSTTDIFYYQAFCAKASSGTPGKTSGRPEPRYQSGRMLCNNNDVPFFTSTTLDDGTPVGGGGGDVDAGVDDAGIDAPVGDDASAGGIAEPDGWSDASPVYLCAETGVTTAEGIRIEGLENGTEYIVSVLVMDRAGNAQGTKFTTTVTPSPVTDFWEDLHDQGSEVEGGFCLLAQAYGDGNPLTHALRSFRDHTLADTMFGRWLIDLYYGTIGSLDLHGSLALRIVVGVLLLPFVVIALLWHVLTLPGLLALIALAVFARKRRLRILAARPARLAAATTIAMLALVPTRAHAQSPYWETHEFTEPEAELPPGDPERVRWHAGVRLGPYVPGIDAQLGMPVGSFDGPYEQMFGGYSILPMLDVDYFLLRSFGQLGVGISAGFMGKKERAWEFGSNPMDPDRPRAAGDYNKFRMLPLSLNAVYRFTHLDDEYGIPLVPYARAGLAYYIWWITAPSGDFAKSCVGPNTSTDCAKTTAAGASLGFVGSIGVALRAERVDESAARSMRESGIEHAGFYAEYSLGKVDGFGSDKKLSLGDATWFAGVDFEF